jgi:predicted NUDIX family NTP pyrophosphohydrolase
MTKIAAGCLVRARFGDETRYLVVHPSGNYNRRRPWSIPKGLIESDELPEKTAVRETREETGIECHVVAPLGEVRYRKSGKVVIGYLAEPIDPPPVPVIEPGDWEIDRAEFLPASEARERLHPDQRAFVDRAEEIDSTRSPVGGT